MSNDAVGTINVYVRATNLTDVNGRVRYATSEAVQKEKLVTVVGEKPAEFWQHLSADSKYYSKNLKEEHSAREAKELIIVLPNKADELSLDEKKRLLQSMKFMIDEQTGTDCMIAWHNSHPGEKEESNTHVHIIIPERVLLVKPEDVIAERNLFFDEKGNRVYRKSDILDHPDQLRPGCSVIKKGTVMDDGEPAKRTMYRDEKGNITINKADVYDIGSIRPGCKVVKKGEVLHTRYFSSKDDDLTRRAWLHSAKEDIAEWINKEIQPDLKRVVSDEFSLFIPQTHIPNKWQPKKPDKISKKESMQKANASIKEYNKLVRNGYFNQEEAENNKTLIMLSPDRNLEITNILNAKKQEIEADYRYTDMTAATPRTRDKNPEKEKLRQLYKESAEAWKEYRECYDSEKKKYLLARGRAASAAIAAQRKRMGMWKLSDYKKDVTNKKNECKFLRKQVKRINKKLHYLSYGLSRHYSKINFIESQIREEEKKLFPDRNYINSLKKEIQEEKQYMDEKREELYERQSELLKEKWELKQKLKRARQEERQSKREFREEKKAERQQAREEKIKGKTEIKSGLDRRIANAASRQPQSKTKNKQQRGYERG